MKVEDKFLLEEKNIFLVDLEGEFNNLKFVLIV